MIYKEKNLEEKVIKKIPTVLNFNPGFNPKDLKLACFIDTETTGLSHEVDEVIEVGFTIVQFDSKGNFYEVVERFNQLREPSKPISDVISSVTGLSNEDLKGQSIDWGLVEEKVSNVDIVVAHNAGFDRKFLEKYSDVFKGKVWGCSQTMVDYLYEFGVSRSNQEFLVWKIADSFYDAHRALDDVEALMFLLNHKGKSGETVFKKILDSSSKPDYIIQAKGSSFSDKDALRNMGCRWNSSSRVWEIKVGSHEIKDITKEMISASPTCLPFRVEIDPLNRFSVRA